jgi:hypothetical protein
MPYTERQKKLFRAAAHNEDIAKRHGMTTEQARHLMEEGEKYPTKPEPKKTDKKKKA